MLSQLLSDKPLIAAATALAGAVVTTVLNAIGLGNFGPELVSVVVGAAGAVVTTYIAGEAHKAAKAAAPAGSTGTTAQTPTASTGAATGQVLTELAAALGQAAQAVTKAG